MAKRGRPPHPDILTPREWEVLALLRDGVSNADIAQRLGISLAGAKFHVSEILSKLGVSSREEAARWERPERPWWMTAFAPLSFLWRKMQIAWLSPAIAAGLLVVVAAGIGLLIWGLLRTSGSDEDAWLGEGWTSEGAPERLTYEPGEEIDVPGVFYLDPDSGEVEGWPIRMWSGDVEGWPAFDSLNGMSPDGRLLVLENLQGRTSYNSSDVGISKLFDTQQGKVCDTDRVVERNATFAPDGSRFVEEARGRWGHIFSSTCGEPSRRWELPERIYTAGGVSTPDWLFVSDLRWAPDGSKLVIAGQYSMARLPMAYLIDLERGTLDLLAEGEQYANSLFNFDWAPDGSRFVLASELDNTVQALGAQGDELWSTELPMEGAGVAQWSPDGSLMAVIGFVWGSNELASTLYVLDGETGEIVTTLPDTYACSSQRGNYPRLISRSRPYMAFCPGQTWTADGERLLVHSLANEPTYGLVDLSGTERLTLPQSVLAAAPSPIEADLIALLDNSAAQDRAQAVAVLRAGTGEQAAAVHLADDMCGYAVGWLDGGRVWFTTVPEFEDMGCLRQLGSPPSSSTGPGP